MIVNFRVIRSRGKGPNPSHDRPEETDIVKTHLLRVPDLRIANVSVTSCASFTTGNQISPSKVVVHKIENSRLTSTGNVTK